MKYYIMLICILCPLISFSKNEDVSYFYSNATTEQNHEAKNNPDSFIFIKDSVGYVYVDAICDDSLLFKLEIKYSEELNRNRLYINGELQESEDDDSFMYIVVIFCCLIPSLFPSESDDNETNIKIEK